MLLDGAKTMPVLLGKSAATVPPVAMYTAKPAKRSEEDGSNNEGPLGGEWTGAQWWWLVGR